MNPKRLWRWRASGTLGSQETLASARVIGKPWGGHTNIRGLECVFEAGTLRIRLVVVTLLAVLAIGTTIGRHASAQIDAKAEEYAVYSAVVARMSASEDIKLVVIREHTVKYPVDSGLLRNDVLARRLAHLSQVTVDDYIAKNQQVKQLSRGFDLKLPYVFFTKEEEEISRVA